MAHQWPMAHVHHIHIIETSSIDIADTHGGLFGRKEKQKGPGSNGSLQRKIHCYNNISCPRIAKIVEVNHISRPSFAQVSHQKPSLTRVTKSYLLALATTPSFCIMYCNRCVKNTPTYTQPAWWCTAVISHDMYQVSPWYDIYIGLHIYIYILIYTYIYCINHSPFFFLTLLWYSYKTAVPRFDHETDRRGSTPRTTV